MSVTSFSCPTCGAGLDASHTNAPTITCRYCNTVIKNPFYKADNAADRIAMPVININVGAAPVPAQPDYSRGAYIPAAMQPAMQRAMQAESPRNRWLALFLSLFLGWFGIHRFYTGHILIGLVQFFTFGGLIVWNIIDMLMILTGTYRDREGRLLSGRGIGKRAILATGATAILVCGALAYLGENASKVDLPADHGWITGSERCKGSSAFGEVVLPDNITLWADWGDGDRGGAVGVVKHGDEVQVLEARRHTGESIYYKIETGSGLKGWISEDFIQFQALEEGTVPREGC